MVVITRPPVVLRAAGSRNNQIIVLTAEELVAVRPTKQRVVTDATVKRVLTLVVMVVIVRLPLSLVVMVPPVQRIRPARPDEQVIAIIARDVICPVIAD